MMRRCFLLWKQWTQPSLMRRLLTAQMLVLALLWTLLLGLVLQNARDAPELLRAKSIYQAIMSVAQNLSDRPQRRQESLRAINRALADEIGDGETDSGLSPNMFVWQDGELIYRSPGGAPVVRNTRPDVVETVRAGAQDWRAHTMASPDGRIEVTLALPDIWQLAISITSRGYYLTPLLISLPFLIFPAWLSVRLALRPWNRVSRETSQRGLGDLTPLSFQPRHKELRPLVRSINMLLQRVRDGTARERSFIADAAHELRTPLAGMRVNVEALKNQSGDEAQRELLDNLLRSNDRVARLVGQLLQLMRSDAAHDSMPRGEVALNALVQDRLAMIEGLAHARGVELELDTEGQAVVVGERESLISMVDNLVDNAIKYSPADGQVTVRVVQLGAQALVQVTDQGPGIPAAWHERVFDRFFRSPDQTQSGSGLGLAIVKSVVMKHGGRIELGSGPHARGLQVTVWLPALPERRPPAAG